MKKFLLLLITLGLMGCSTTINEVGVIVPEGVSFNYKEIERSSIIKSIKGSDSTSIFFVFPLGFPSLNKAINQTLETSDGDILTNVTITEKTIWNGLFGEMSIEVIADVVKLPNKKEKIHD